MPWVKIDDGFYDHPKVMALLEGEGLKGYAALGLYTLALSYCGRHLTDGFVPARVIRAALRLADILVRYEFWHPSEGGYTVHNYLQRNPSKEQVEAERERVRNWKLTRSGTRSGAVLESVENRSRTRPVPIPNPKDKKTVQYGKVILTPEGFVVPDPLLEQWVQAYPSVDVLGEIRRAHAWAVANPEKAKKNWSRFLVNWLADKQSKAPRVQPPAEKVRPAVLDDPEMTPEQIAENMARVRELTSGIGRVL